jgi:hypothetical protein
MGGVLVVAWWRGLSYMFSHMTGAAAGFFSIERRAQLLCGVALHPTTVL